MTSHRAPLLLLDGASMWFRSYFGVPSSIKAPDGSIAYIDNRGERDIATLVRMALVELRITPHH